MTTDFLIGTRAMYVPAEFQLEHQLSNLAAQTVLTITNEDLESKINSNIRFESKVLHL